MNRRFPFLLTLMMLGTTCHATILVTELGSDESSFFSNPTGAASESVVWNTPADASDVSSADDVLVLSLAAKWNMTGITVQYGTTPMLSAASIYGNPLDSQNVSGVWYLLNPDTPGLNFTISWTNTHGTGRNDEFYVRAFYVDGVEQNSPDVAQTGTAATDVTSFTLGGFEMAADGFVTDVVALNNSIISSTEPTGGLGEHADISNSNGSRHASSYLVAQMGDTISSTWTFAANTPPKSGVLVVFSEAIPEPGSLGLLLLGSVAILSRRMRARV